MYLTVRGHGGWVECEEKVSYIYIYKHIHIYIDR